MSQTRPSCANQTSDNVIFKFHFNETCNSINRFYYTYSCNLGYSKVYDDKTNRGVLCVEQHNATKWTTIAGNDIFKPVCQLDTSMIAGISVSIVAAILAIAITAVIWKLIKAKRRLTELSHIQTEMEASVLNAYMAPQSSRRPSVSPYPTIPLPPDPPLSLQNQAYISDGEESAGTPSYASSDSIDPYTMPTLACQRNNDQSEGEHSSSQLFRVSKLDSNRSSKTSATSLTEHLAIPTRAVHRRSDELSSSDEEVTSDNQPTSNQKLVIQLEAGGNSPRENQSET